MDGILQWAKNILTVVIAFTFLQVLVPESSLGKYVRFILSLILLVVILEPVLWYISA